MINNIYCISVVRDHAMYDKCIRNNPFCRQMSLTAIDNTSENKGIPTRYNEFLEHFDGEGWIIFCHEDWQLDEDILPFLENADTKRLYGPIGSFVKECKHSDFIVTKGRTIQGTKDFSSERMIKIGPREGRVDTFDCQCLIVHHSLIRQYGLRFDERLSFDLYVEDFCVNAYDRYGIESYVLPILCHHYSLGSITDRFHASLEYLREKYRESRKRYSSTVGRHSTFGRNPEKPVYNLRNQPGSIIRYWCKR